VQEAPATPGLAEERADRRCLRVRGQEALAGRCYWRRGSCIFVANGIGIRSHGPSAHGLEVTFDFTVEGSKEMRLVSVTLITYADIEKKG
jgi:hypothetical protein